MPTYYNVPDFPGVPPLLRDPSGAGLEDDEGTSLLGPGDDIGGTSGALTAWGLFDEDGQQVLFPDSFLGIEFRNSRRISNYPLEQGSFASYNKVNDPFDIVVGMSCGGGEAKLSAFLATCKALSEDLNLYSVVTPEEVFDSVNVERYDYARKQHNGATLVTVNLYLKEIRINTKSEYSNTSDSAPTVEEAAAATTSETSNTTNGAVLAPEDVQNPASASPQSQGQVQAAPATSQQAAPAPSLPPALPEGYTQEADTGLVIKPDGFVDEEWSIRVGAKMLAK